MRSLVNLNKIKYLLFLCAGRPVCVFVCAGLALVVVLELVQADPLRHEHLTGGFNLSEKIKIIEFINWKNLQKCFLGHLLLTLSLKLHLL